MRIQIHPHCHFKTGKVRERAQYLDPSAGALLYAIADWCEVRQIPCMVTETVTSPEEDAQLERDSVTHVEARAFDLSVRAWSEKDIQDFEIEFEEKWGMMGALSAKTGERNLVHRHNSGHGDHLHVQLSRLYAVKNPLASGEPQGQG